MSDANYTEIAFVEEATYGITPDDSNLRLLRLTGESLAHTKETVVSQELRSDRQRSDLVLVGAMATGSLQIEFSQAEYQTFLLAALGAAAWTVVNVTATATASATAQTLVTTGAGFADVPVGGYLKLAGLANAASNGIKKVISKSVDNNTLTFAAGSLAAAEVGASVTITGKDARNGIAKHHFTMERAILTPAGTKQYQAYTGMSVDTFNLTVASKALVTGEIGFMGKVGAPSDNSLNTLNGDFAGGILTCGATDPADGDVVVIGNRTYTLKTVLGSTIDGILLSGTPATLAANIRAAIKGAAGGGYGTTHNAALPHSQVALANETADATVELTALLMGAAGNAIATTTTASTGELDWGAATLTGGVTATAPIARTTNPVLSGSSNVGQIYQDATLMQERFKTLGLSIKNNLRGKDAIGEIGAFEIGWGTIDVTGNLEAYFRDNTLYRQLVNHETTGIGFMLTGADGAAIGVTLPAVKFGSGDPQATAINTDVMLKTDYTAIMDETLGCTIIVSAFDAA